MARLAQNSKYPFNRERLLLTLLVALAFFGFLLWAIEESSQEELLLMAIDQNSANPMENKIIKIISPKANEAIKSPALISGRALTFTGALQIKIKDASGLILAQKQIVIRENSSFNFPLAYKKPTQSKGIIEFIGAQKNISGTNKLTMPITFKD